MERNRSLRRLLACLMCAMMIFAFIPSVCAEDVATPDEAESTEGSGETGETGEPAEGGETGNTGNTGNTGDTGNTGSSDCSHPDIDVYERFVGPSTYLEGGTITNKTHVAVRARVRITWCRACGRELNAEDIEPGEVVENHSIGDNGECTKCGIKVDYCEHTSYHWEPLYFKNGPQQPLNAREHGYPNGAWYNTYVCDACGDIQIDADHQPEWLYNDTQAERHEFEDGVCWKCDFEQCTHPKDSVEDVLTQTTYATLGYTQHNMTVKAWKVLKCPDCDAVFSRELTKDETTAQDHTFVDGVCTLCGQKACTHENKTEKKTYQNKRDYQIIDENTHSFTADVTIEKTCKDCGAALEPDEKLGVTDLTEDHASNDDGYCALCGYCSHIHKVVTRSVIENTVGYNDRGDTHEKYWNEHHHTECPGCGMVKDEDILGEENREIESNLPHDFRTGKCVCGKDCPHTDTVFENRHFDWKNSKVTSYNDTVHVITANMIANKKCSACGTVVEYNAVVEENVQLTETHTFNAEGKCETEGCGATGTGCQHDGKTYEDTRFTYRLSTPVTAWNNATHTVPGTEIVTTYCSKCNAQIGEPVERNAEQQIPHSIQNGKCVQEGCGYEGEGCGHEHPKTETDEILQRNQKSLGHDQHEYFVDVVEYTGCDDCMTLISEKIIEEGRRKVENHEFVNGKCVVCGETQHPKRVTKQEYEQQRDFAPIDAHTHSFLADVYEVVTCEDCGEQISRTKVASAAEKTGEHSFDEKGECTLCGYCSHKVTEKRSTDLLETTQYADNHDGETHVRTWNVQIDNVCVNCGAVVGESGMETENATERHTYADNCTCACGAVHHANTKVPYQGFDMDKAEVISYNEGAHTLKTNIVGDEICQDCYRVVESKKLIEADVTFSGSHELDSEGKCVVCGYKPACAHEHIGTDVDYDDYSSTASQWDEEGHTVVAEMYVYTYCEDCGALLGRETTTTEPIKLPHRFVKNIDTCIVDGCEAKNECTHDSTEERVYENNARNYASISASEHQYKADIIKAVYCADCGVLLSREVTQQGATLTEEHVFVQGVCVSCGYVKPAETPKPAPTAQPEETYRPTSRPTVATTPAPVVATPVPTVAPTAAPTKQPIVETLFEAVAEAEAEGKDVQVEIVGAQEVMTQEEYTELKTLNAQEQVLVTLKSAGLDEVVQAAMSAMNVTLSGEAESLMEKVGTRVETMTVEEKTAYEDKLAEYFPVTERVINGVTVRTFTIDMKIVVDGFERVERYQFYLDENGEWIFEKVDLASFGRL